jgi:ERCC4-related helicase
MADINRFAPDDRVRHTRFGTGTVIADTEAVVVAHFTHGIEACLRNDLERLRSLTEELDSERWAAPIEVINRVQAETIRSINDAWGVFTPARMELLPHQLWVCHQVASSWPARWLVADDVGLGKTVEAGMILSAFIARGTIRRLLILCPASLVVQWQERMREMFDIRLTPYVPEMDTPRTDFWGTHNYVIASVQTLRKDIHDRKKRLLDAAPWDMVIVDEAHHLNADEEKGPTHGYRLLRDMEEQERIRSLVLFTGTPHRGKDFGFISLLRLLDRERFDPRQPAASQLRHLPSVMIRNNKSNVTNLRGERLFQPATVLSETYTYSPEEENFYRQLTEFIITGRTYASSLNKTHGRAVMLVLIAMQKLASSSVAAVRRALAGRLERIITGHTEEIDLLRMYDENRLQDEEDWNLQDEQAVRSASLALMQNEAAAIRQLIAAADAVVKETRIHSLLEVLRTRFTDRTVLFFTEYKATQALLLSALLCEFGGGCVTFINGDERLDNVLLPDGRRESLSMPRETAARQFNEGTVRFLISTEAAGEGIDLQRNCHTLIHVDLPWNPMRLHQRVGRLHRYGQTQAVEVMTLRNPETVESLIWERLTEKLERISQALGSVMEDPEDLQQLVLGMTSPAVFRDLFAEADTVPRERLSELFDARSARFAGDDVVETVRKLLGSVRRFDFGKVSAQLPRVDLPDLRPFLETALARYGRRLREEDDGLTFLTPDSWRKNIGVRDEYRGQSFDRQNSHDNTRLLGVGHKVIDYALQEVLRADGTATMLPVELLPYPLVVFRLRDQVTGTDKASQWITLGIRLQHEGTPELLRDWELLKWLNALPQRRTFMTAALPAGDHRAVQQSIDAATAFLSARLDTLGHRFHVPLLSVSAVFWPDQAPASLACPDMVSAA